MDECYQQNLKQFYEQELFAPDQPVPDSVEDDKQKPIISVKVENVGEAIWYLNTFFSGRLTCVFCNETIALENQQVTDHEKACLRKVLNLKNSIENKEIAEVQRMPDNSLTSSNFIENKLKTLIANLSNMKNEEFHDLVRDPSNPELIQKLKDVNLVVKLFHCLDCNVCDDIQAWEVHIHQFHTDCSKLNYHVSCTCWLCETLIFGERKHVINHSHFKIDKHFFTLSHYPRLADVFNLARLPNYFIFEFMMTGCNNDDVDLKIGYYCLVCDKYSFEKLNKHFSSSRHKLKANLFCDLYFCETCNVLIYGDERLLTQHQISWIHVYLKRKHRNNNCCPKEEVQHQFLLTSLKLEIERVITGKRPQFNLQCLSFYCALCSSVFNTRSKWNLHLKTDAHFENATRKENQNLISDIKPFEYICIHCKLCIFGAFPSHVTHINSLGHKNIKQTVLNNLNDRNLEETEIPVINKSPSVSSQKAEETNKIKESENEIYSKVLSIENPCDYVVNLRKFLQETLSAHKLKKSVTFYCWFCNFQLNEQSWWYHLTVQTHIDNVNLYNKNIKKTTAVVMYCCSCDIVLLGPSFIKSVHLKKSHVEKSIQPSTELVYQQPPSQLGVEKSKTSETEFNFLKPNDRKWRSVFQGGSQELSTRISGSSEENFVDISNSNCSNPTESALCRSQSMSSNASSTICDIDDKSDDEADDLYMLVNGESEDENKESEQELDDSVLNEMEAHLNGPTKLNEPNGQSSTAENYSNETSGVGPNADIVKKLIIAKGLPPQIIKNKKFCLTTFSKYGNITRIFSKKSKPDWLYMLVLTEPEKVFNSLKRNIETLKVKLGTDELTIEHDIRNTDYTGIRKQLAPEIENLFAKSDELEKAVYNLIRKYNIESNSIESRNKIQKIEADVLTLAQMLYGPTVPVKVYTFGSRVTGLATENSDVDIYLQINNSFGGGFHDNNRLQEQLVLLFSKKMKLYHRDFKNIISIPFARVPIVKFTHAKSHLNCDLSFKSGLSTMNSMLVKSYLNLDDRIKFVVCAVKIWMKENDLADRNFFTTYAQIWMVLFFLMQTDIAVVPPVIALRNMLPPTQQNVIVEGWNCAFPNIHNIVWRTACTLTEEELLLKFFQFYSHENLQNYVMCTLTGIKLQKKYFLETFERLPDSFNQYKLKMKSDRALYWRVVQDYEGLCIQDPFDHCHNLTKTINTRKFQAFINLCRLTVVTMTPN